MASYSEINSFVNCRQKWFWIYDRRIEKRRLSQAISVGSAGHVGLAAALKGGDYKEAINKWLGEEIASRDLFDEEVEQFTNTAELAKDIVRKYLDYWEPFHTILAVEEAFSVPIQSTDERLEGYIDALVKDKMGNVWLCEHKFVKQFRREEDIVIDMQLGLYHYALLKKGLPIMGIIYNQLLTVPETKPSILKNGTMSRAQCKCTWETYKATCEENDIDPELYREEMEPKLAHVEFFRRFYIPREEPAVKQFAQFVNKMVWDMRRKGTHIYPNVTFACRMCQYRELCGALLAGQDPEELIEIEYIPRKKRVTEEVEEIDTQLN